MLINIFFAQGYTFDAEANGHSFKVTVPVGGVEEGQKFSVPFPAGANGYSGAAIPRASVPVGHWKDGLCDCCQHGLIHPALWNACCCPMVLVGQIMHRLKLTWLGSEGTTAQTVATFRILLCITILFYSTDTILHLLPASFAQIPEQELRLFLFLLLALTICMTSVISCFFRSTLISLAIVSQFYLLCAPPDEEETFSGSTTMYAISRLVDIVFCAFLIFLVAKTRKHIREKYSIPEKQCKGCEDYCCSLWCTCCTVAQMARHTADYETYAGLCCSETGIPPRAPSIV